MKFEFRGRAKTCLEEKLKPIGAKAITQGEAFSFEEGAAKPWDKKKSISTRHNLKLEQGGYILCGGFLNNKKLYQPPKQQILLTNYNVMNKTRRTFLKTSMVAGFGVVAMPNLLANHNEKRLIVRADDIGSSHAANLGCIESYKKGIARSVELMVPCPWLVEAVQMLNENPGYDVGVHLTITSEWPNYKWGSLTNCRSILDEKGNFYPFIWKNDRTLPGTTIMEAEWKIEDIEKELRAQIELALEKVPHITHLTEHMGCLGFSEESMALREKLQNEYNLPLIFENDDLKRPQGWSGNFSTEEKIERFISMLDTLKPGNTYLTVEHPAYNYPEMQAIHPTDKIGEKRESVIDVFTSEKVKKAIQEKNIKLISYKDLINS